MNESMMRVLTDMFPADTPKPPRALPEAQIEELKMLLIRYSQRGRFGVSDIITPVENSPFKHKGMPCIVLEIDSEPIKVDAKYGQSSFGVKPDIRVGYIDEDGDLLTLWTESYWYVPYVAPTA